MAKKAKVKRKGPKGKVTTISFDKFNEPIVRPLRDIKRKPAGGKR